MRISNDAANRLANLIGSGAVIELLAALNGNGSQPIVQQTLTTISTAGAATYTASQLLKGTIERDCNGGARTDTTDTAANIIAAIPNAAVGDQFTTTVMNITGSALAITLAGGTGVTLKGNTSVAQSKMAILKFIVTSSTAVTCHVSVSS